jgi:hypothetical protein
MPTTIRDDPYSGHNVQVVVTDISNNGKAVSGALSEISGSRSRSRRSRTGTATRTSPSAWWAVRACAPSPARSARPRLGTTVIPPRAGTPAPGVGVLVGQLMHRLPADAEDLRGLGSGHQVRQRRPLELGVTDVLADHLDTGHRRGGQSRRGGLLEHPGGGGLAGRVDVVGVHGDGGRPVAAVAGHRPHSSASRSRRSDMRSSTAGSSMRVSAGEWPAAVTSTVTPASAGSRD